MTHIKEILQRFKVQYSAKNRGSGTEGGAIKQILNSSAIHRVTKPAKPCDEPIVAQSIQSARANSGFNTGIFEAIGGAV